MPAGGSKVGRQVKKKQEFRALVRAYCKKRKVDPFHFFVDVIAGDVDVNNGEAVKLDHKLTAAKELAQYVEPKLRAMEMKVVPEVSHTHEDAEMRQARIAALEKKRAAVMPLELLAGEPRGE